MAGKTIKDIASDLGLSAATVSRALAGNPRISLETRQKVAEAAAAIGYVPNRAAQSLVGRRSSGFAGLILTDPGYGRDDSYLGEFLTGLGQGLAEHGIDLFLSAVPEDKDELAVIRNIVASRRADGLILARTLENDRRVDFLLEANFPFVTHGRIGDPQKPVAWLDTDGGTAFAEAFHLLHGLGHRRFALLTMEEETNFRRHRTEGLEGAIAAANDPSVTLATASTPRFDRERRHRAARALLTLEPRPTAIVCLTDGFALDVLYEARELGLSVPGDLSVIGFDDIPSAARAQLTTFDTETSRSARRLAHMLARRIDRDDPGPPETCLVPPRLLLRGTHGPAPRPQ